ncbi:2-succinyl-5-enolpyruvyl-6-hydroxy-3-cyclohexene-1-carboxylic-acid synthase [Ferrimicrobium sp.]|uniref:2-succinyl-5-enolpyruvyl-6-hydroxy-3- cyclohexene-1-carboxylic-acid synthase n=1 Tax=Ferrimicrobium sp. TaxID=2926050 RepID=UPI00262B7D0B|nr:2-succinyl-5-enolpyruvyl-6-hydroxy-3-cyclohexene-1-carboxylic-acid synthase [Ferrimicrobium sp.]MCL5972970.1 2-succinyl-5-enolpyruvyl-6-hydroxy-3-cyclohexene-1-carboxylic-acid synthase [Actinomycetota bacterium]
MKSSASTSKSRGSNVGLCAILVDELTWLGVRRVVIAPGSRSTPLAVALAASTMEVSTCLDERAAAFFALGIARRTGEPVMVVTTSGTASLELVPAVAEASLGGIPLLVVTADRPARLRGVSAPQTLDQLQALTGFVRRTLALELLPSLSEGDLASIARQLVLELVGAPDGPGPVHLNIGIDEPLLGDGYVADDLAEEFFASRDDRARVRPVSFRPRLGALDPLVMAEIFDPGRHGWLLLGGAANTGGEEGEKVTAAVALSERLGWVLGADARTQVATSPNVVIHLDGLARGACALPEIAVVIGDFPLARSVMAALRAIVAAGGEVVTLNDRFVVRDPGRFVTGSYVVDVRATLCMALEDLVRAQRVAASDSLVALDRRIDAIIERFVIEHGDTEIAFARRLHHVLTGHESLFVSASMPIRYLDQFRGYHDDPPLVAMNRGANGIDGVVASYLGFADAAPDELATLLIGDLATLYDIGALIHLPLPRKGLIVVLDNQGGLIFDQVPPATQIPIEVQTELFVAPPRIRPARVLEGLGLEVVRVKRADELDALVERARAGAFLVAAYEGTRTASAGALSSLYARIDLEREKERTQA